MIILVVAKESTMKQLGTKLPTSKEELSTLAVICLVVAVGTAGKFLMGNDTSRAGFRRAAGGGIMSALTAMLLYTVLIAYSGLDKDTSGYIAVGVASFATIFTQEILERARDLVVSGNVIKFLTKGKDNGAG